MFNNVDYYTRMMMEAFDENDIVSTPTMFVGSFFGIQENGGQTEFVDDASLADIDIIRADGETMAPTVHRGTSTSPDTKIGVGEEYTNFTREFGLIEKESAINSVQLLKRTPGMTPYQLQTQTDRMRKLAIKLHKNDIRKVIRTHEYFARQSILTGTHPAMLGTTNTDLIYDFKRNSSNIVTVGTAWDGAADPISDVDAGCDQIRKTAHVTADALLLGGSAYEAMIKNANFKSQINTSEIRYTKFDFENETPSRFARFIKNGWQLRGKMQTYKGRIIYVFTNNDIFTDDFTNPAVPASEEWMPLDQGLLAFSGARCDRWFGPKDRLELTPEDKSMYQFYFGMNADAVTLPQNIKDSSLYTGRMFHFDAEREGKKTIKMITQSSVIYPTTQTDAFYTLKGLVS